MKVNNTIRLKLSTQDGQMFVSESVIPFQDTKKRLLFKPYIRYIITIDKLNKQSTWPNCCCLYPVYEPRSYLFNTLYVYNPHLSKYGYVQKQIHFTFIYFEEWE